ATDNDVRDLNDVSRALDLEEAGILDKRADTLRGMLLFDTRIRKTRDAMADWMHEEANARRVHDADPGYLTIAARTKAERLLADEHRHAKMSAASLAHPPPSLHSADRLL